MRLTDGTPEASPLRLTDNFLSYVVLACIAVFCGFFIRWGAYPAVHSNFGPYGHVIHVTRSASSGTSLYGWLLGSGPTPSAASYWADCGPCTAPFGGCKAVAEYALARGFPVPVTVFDFGEGGN